MVYDVIVIGGGPAGPVSYTHLKSSCLSLVPDAGFDHGKAAFAGSSAAGRRSDMPVRNEYEGE